MCELLISANVSPEVRCAVDPDHEPPFCRAVASADKVVVCAAELYSIIQQPPSIIPSPSSSSSTATAGTASVASIGPLVNLCSHPSVDSSTSVSACRCSMYQCMCLFAFHESGDEALPPGVRRGRLWWSMGVKVALAGAILLLTALSRRVLVLEVVDNVSLIITLSFKERPIPFLLLFSVFLIKFEDND